jgi:quinolinate synthase
MSSQETTHLNGLPFVQPAPVTETAAADGFEARYTLPAIEEVTDTAEEILEKQKRVRELAKKRNAILLAHHYQRPEVQEVADCVADSLRLSQTAAKTGADVIVFCGVHFMAETASILCPEKVVLLPDLRAGCSLSAAITAEELRAWKARYPGAVVVSYINTSAAVKAESDYCCTSANAAKVVQAIPADKPILFVPDKFLGQVVARQSGRSNIFAYPGYCHVHKTIRPEDVDEIVAEHPDAELLLHPECGCVSSCMAKALDGSLPFNRTFFLSTEGMLKHIAQSPAREFAVGTEMGILHRLNKEFSGRKFYPVNPNAVCAFMKTITLERVLRSLEEMAPEVRVPAEIAQKARRAIDRMLELA